MWEALFRMCKRARLELQDKFPMKDVCFYIGCCRVVGWLRRPSTVSKLSDTTPRHVQYCVRCAVAEQFRKIGKVFVGRWQRDNAKKSRREWVEDRIRIAERTPAVQEFLKHADDFQSA